MYHWKSRSRHKIGGVIMKLPHDNRIKMAILINTQYKKPAQIWFHLKWSHTITKKNNKINMDSAIPDSVIAVQSQWMLLHCSGSECYYTVQSQWMLRHCSVREWYCTVQSVNAIALSRSVNDIALFSPWMLLHSQFSECYCTVQSVNAIALSRVRYNYYFAHENPIADFVLIVLMTEHDYI